MSGGTIVLIVVACTVAFCCLGGGILMVVAAATGGNKTTTVAQSPGTTGRAPGTTESIGTVPPAPGTTEAVDPDEAVEPGAEEAAAAAPSAVAVAAPACRGGDPLANVYHPSRLRVIDACRTVSGTVAKIKKEDDGDYHINLMPDDPSVVNDANRSKQAGALVVEIVPADEPGCAVGQPPKPVRGTYDYGTCTGSNLTSPQEGSHVWVTGPYVLDTAHGWMEIHPAWGFSTSDPTTTTTTSTEPPTTPAPPTTPTPTTPAPAPTPAPTAPALPPSPPTTSGSAHPVGTTGLCNDGTFTSAAHSQGACSHHGGLAAYWGPGG